MIYRKFEIKKTKEPIYRNKKMDYGEKLNPSGIYFEARFDKFYILQTDIEDCRKVIDNFYDGKLDRKGIKGGQIIEFKKPYKV